MARKNEYGRNILSAGEIAAYTVCPESWRLQYVEKAHRKLSERVQTGDRLHKEWAASVEEAMLITRGTRLVLLLLCAAIVFYLLTARY